MELSTKFCWPLWLTLNYSLVLPTVLASWRPEWSTCTENGFDVAYDPPRTHVLGSLLVPTTAASKRPPAIETASPGAVSTLPEVTLSPPGNFPPVVTTLSAIPVQQPPVNPENNDHPRVDGTTLVPSPPSVRPQETVPGVPQPDVIIVTLVPGSPDGGVVTLIPTQLPAKQPQEPNQAPQPPTPPQPQNPSQASNVGDSNAVFRPPDAQQHQSLPQVTDLGNPNLPQTTDSGNPNQTPESVAPPQAQIPSQSSIPAILIGTQILAPGQAITVGGITSTLQDGRTTVVNGHQFSLDPEGKFLVVDGTSTLSVTLPKVTNAVGKVDPQTLTIDQINQQISTSIYLTPNDVIKIGEQTFTVDAAGRLMSGSQTVSLGSVTVMDGTVVSFSGSVYTTGGTTVSVAADGRSVVVNGRTVAVGLQTTSSKVQGTGVVMSKGGEAVATTMRGNEPGPSTRREDNGYLAPTTREKVSGATALASGVVQLVVACLGVVLALR
jgi:hypothetical protein